MPRPGFEWLLVFVLLLGAARASFAQSPRLPPAISQTQGTGSPPVTGGTDDAQRQQAISANQQRQLEIRRDAEKMAELTQELKQYLEKTDQGVISVDIIKKAEQIEKLAHGVKSKMKQSF